MVRRAQMRLSSPDAPEFRVYSKEERALMRRTSQLATVLATGFLVAAGQAMAAPEAFQFDKNDSLVGFRIRHFVSKVEGRFKDFEGTITLDRQNPGASK